MPQGREFTVIGIERLHEGQEVYEVLSVTPPPPEEYAPSGVFRVQPHMVSEGDTIAVTLEARRSDDPSPGGRPIFIDVPVVRRADGKVISAQA